jgi:hypothetical protein
LIDHFTTRNSCRGIHRDLPEGDREAEKTKRQKGDKVTKVGLIASLNCMTVRLTAEI